MDHERAGRKDAWAMLRFSIIGPLLAAPPAKGGLQEQLRDLAAKSWKHPVTSAPVRFGRSTIERWYYLARRATDPVATLRRRLRKDAGGYPSLSEELKRVLLAQYKAHSSWSYRLHAENLAATVRADAGLGPAPSENSVRRFMQSKGLFKQRRRRAKGTPGERFAEERLARLEVRSYEAELVHTLWHSDFHVGSKKVLTGSGVWVTPYLFAALDDRSRLACHAQWYLGETAEAFAHGLSQAIQKRGLPRALMTDNGSAMLAAEIQQGLSDLGIPHETTLPHSPYQNAKQEAFWGPVEGRLVAMLEGIKDLTLELLNEATQAWVELDYNRKVHSETGAAPLSRFLEDLSVGRPSPASNELRRAFRMKLTRAQRRSDGTLTVEGVRFEIPNRFRHLRRLTVKAARWDLSSIDLVDPQTNQFLAPLYPLDKAANADARRRHLDPIGPEPCAPPPTGMAPRLKEIMAEYAATGLPPAYLPQPRKETSR